jgi:DNA-binding beta-propeller fold protein YncE
MRTAPARWPRRIAIGAAVFTVAATIVLPGVHRTPARAAPTNLARFASFAPGAALAGAGDPEVLSPTEYRTPNGWGLRPAGGQVVTPRAPTGDTVSPNGKTVVAVNSGIFDEQLVVVDAATLAHTLAPSTDLFMGAAIDSAGNVWVSTGSRNRVYQYRLNGPTAEQVRGGVGLIPGSPNNGIPVIGYPGNMVLGEDGRLFVAGNLSVPSTYIEENGGPPCRSSDICSVVNVIDVSNPFAPSPAVHFVPVGRDAYGIAVNPATQTLYVSNWADETNPARAGGRGTVSVVDISTPGEEHEVQVVAVGRHPTGVALSKDGRTLFVANTADTTLSKIRLDPATGLATAASTIDVRTTGSDPRAAAPIALSFSPDGKFLYVSLAGLNAIEVRNADGSAISQKLPVAAGKKTAVTVPHTYIPTGWYPDAIATGPSPTGDPGSSRLYVANLKGMGAGPGLNGQAEPIMGSRTQGTLSAIDVPNDRKSPQLTSWTKTVVENDNLLPLFTSTGDPAKNPCLPIQLPQGGTAFSQVLCDASRGTIDPRQFHVIYIVKENKTFDQYFGDINGFGVPDADASPEWLLYGQPVTTNQHKIAAQWTVMDRFWADSEASTTGHSWTSAGYANEYIEITWNQEYDEGIRGNRGGGAYEGNVFSGFTTDERVAKQEGELFEPAERLVDVFADGADNPTGATYRIYSDDVEEDSPAAANRVPLSLWGIGASAVHHGRDLDFPDTDRAAIFLDGHTVSHAWTVCGIPCTEPPSPPPPSFEKEIGLCGAPNDPAIPDAPESFCDRPGASPDEYGRYSFTAWTQAYVACRQSGGDDTQCQRTMPNFLYMALPIDHTLGFNPYTPTPASMVADNDQAVGNIVEALSRTPFWKNTLILITEDDTQLAGDHVDAHRTFLLAAGGLAREHGAQGEASHQDCSFPCILKTVEVLFRLPSLTIYDRSAAPLHDVVVPSLDATNSTEYQAETPAVQFERNPATGELAELSQMLDWRLDMGNPDLITALIYHGLRGWPLPNNFAEWAGAQPSAEGVSAEAGDGD